MKKEILVSLAWAAGIILVSLAATLARKQGLIDGDTALRVVAMNGLVIAYYANLAPKKFAPSAAARRLARFGGWVLVISGLAYAGFWAFAPLPVAKVVGTGSLVLGIVITFIYGFRLRGELTKPNER